MPEVYDDGGAAAAIIDRDLFDAVQAKLGEKQRRPRSKGDPRRPHVGALFMGLIYDSAGNRVSPVSCSRKIGATYRYYVRRRSSRGAGEGGRVSAGVGVDRGTGRADHVQDLGFCRPIDLAPKWSRVRDLLLIRTAFLARDLKQPILDGDQPVGLTLQRVMTHDVPLDWDVQRQLYRA